MFARHARTNRPILSCSERTGKSAPENQIHIKKASHIGMPFIISINHPASFIYINMKSGWYG